MIKEKTRKYLKYTVITIAFILVSLIVGCQPSEAYVYWDGTEEGGKPFREWSHYKTGLFPQILRSPRTFDGELDADWPYDEDRTITIDREKIEEEKIGVVYCAKAGAIVRFGQKDFTIYYPDVETVPNQKEYYENRQKEKLERKAKAKVAETRLNQVTFLYCDDKEVWFDGDIDWNEPIFQSGEYVSDALEGIFKGLMGKIYEKLEPDCVPVDIKGLPAYNARKTPISWNGDAVNGPTVCVMETPEGPWYTIKEREIVEINNQKAYILTALEDVYNTSTPHKKYEEADIQTAFWMLMKELTNDNYDASEHYTKNGMLLKEKAEEYEAFLQELEGGYKASLDNTNAQVIVNQNTKSYIVGPFSITYPEYQDISYVKALYLTTDTGETLIYDEKNGDLEILCNKEALPSNGQLKTYPASDEYFYIKFSASTAKYPKNIKLYVDFEYISETRTKYNSLWTEAHIYQYHGHYQEDGKYPMKVAQGAGKTTAYYSYQQWDDDEWNPKTQSNGAYVTRYGSMSITISKGEANYSIKLVQPYVQMSNEVVQTLEGQPLIVTLEGSRTYSVYEVSTPIDLTFELGGKVWVDGTAGKENSYDGIFNTNTDTPMPNVKVSLYQVDGMDGNLPGTFAGATTTDENGNYLFEDVNSMFQYYVKFTYNGQYYQPTIYNANRDDANWANNSKGLDILKERDEFNAKFEEIGSAPENTVGFDPRVEMHTRQELQDAGLIDEFGNIPGDLDENGERKSTDEYVNYSMMDSYTCNGTSTKDLYPGFPVFVIDTYLNNQTNTQEVLSFIGATDVKILYGNPDLVHHINQGYVLRELVDLAMRKDVYKATLEINGKTQVYKYNKREGLETDDNGNSYWELSTRISDGYYNYEYSRELYREDYDYKVNDYGDNGKGNYQLKYADDTTSTSLENLGLTEDSELKIYVTYKYTIRNRSEHIATKVTEIVDYYDKDYTFVADRSYLGDNSGNKIGEIVGESSSKYGQNTQTNIEGYNNLYIRGENGGDLPLSDPDDASKDVYLYLTFIVNKDENRNNILDEKVSKNESERTPIGVGKENIAEINGYKSYYGKKAQAPNTGNDQTEQEYVTGDIAGIPDRNSTPGNLDKNDVPKDGAIKYENFENDTDKAPNIRIILNWDNVRTIEGTVWEDARTVESSLARVGNGIRDEGEVGVNGVRVQLVELRQGTDGKTYEYIWKEVYSGDTDQIKPIIDNSKLLGTYSITDGIKADEKVDGKYKFTSFAPGTYIVRFIYGSGESSILGTTYTNYNTGDEVEGSNEVTKLYSENGYGTKTGAETNGGYSKAASSIGLNKNSYNGQDYKSTSYQKDLFNYDLYDNTEKNIDDNYSAKTAFSYNSNAQLEYSFNEAKADEYNFSEADGTLYSDAKDKQNAKNSNVINIAPEEGYLAYTDNNGNLYTNCINSRSEVEDYSDKDEVNQKAEILSAHEIRPEYNYSGYSFDEMKWLLNEEKKNTYMTAETGAIDINFEYNRTGAEDDFTNTSASGKDNISKSDNYEMCGYYVLKNLDFGLEQRPKAQLKVTKQITNVKLTLANGSTLFDASERATNVLWIPHVAHGQDTQNTYKTSDNYSNNMMLNPIVRQSTTNKGKVQLSMDEELMHGSTIQITYAITVANVGEVDYNENQFYYTGKVGNTNTIVKTNPRKLVDYVGTQVHEYGANDDNTATRNNLQFISEQNTNWTVISSDDVLNSGLVNKKLTDNVKKYADGHIIVTEAVSKDLIPIIADEDSAKKIRDAFSKDPLNALETVNSTKSVSGVQLVLSQMITQDITSDDRAYNNMAEIVTTHNDVGRRMAYSVVGNQDPTMEPREIDADDSQEVVILPPFGQKYIYYVLGTAVAVILIAGISITIMVLRKRK